jgi:amidase
MTQTWSDIASSAQKSLLDSIPAKWRLPQPLDSSLTDVRSVPATCGLLTDQQLEITEQTASELMAQLREGKLSSVDVTEAFCARAAIAHQCVNRILSYRWILWTALMIQTLGQLLDSVLPR